MYAGLWTLERGDEKYLFVIVITIIIVNKKYESDQQINISGKVGNKEM